MTNKDLEQLITEYGKDIYSFCVHLTGNRDIADDLYQETFLVAVNRRRTLVKIEEPKAYLLSVAMHVWTNMKRKYARRMGIAPETSYDDALLAEAKDHTDEAILVKERQQQVQEAVAKLPEKMRVVVLLYYMENVPVKQIATMLRIPEGTVKSRLKHARDILAVALEEFCDE